MGETNTWAEGMHSDAVCPPPFACPRLVGCCSRPQRAAALVYTHTRHHTASHFLSFSFFTLVWMVVFAFMFLT